METESLIFEFDEENHQENAVPKEEPKSVTVEDYLIKRQKNSIKDSGEFIDFFGIKVIKDYPKTPMTWKDKKGQDHIIAKDKKRSGGQVRMITSLCRKLGIYNPSEETFVEYPEYSFQCSDLIEKLLRKSRETTN